jgi:hypothetical protein
VIAGDLSAVGLSSTSGLASVASSDPHDVGLIEIAFADRRLRLPVSTSPALASAVIGALVQR